MDHILILDFGGQTCQLISRRIREMGVFTKILPGDSTAGGISLQGCTGIILSGSPYSVYEEGAPTLDRDILKIDVPILGICYGAQLLTHLSGGKVSQMHTREYGRAKLRYREANALFTGVPENFESWMSHGDSIELAAADCAIVAESEHGIPAAISFNSSNGRTSPILGIQFHPEVSHCEFGTEILKNFALGICKSKAEWNVNAYTEEASQKIREVCTRKDGSARQILLLISGGVDSTCLGALLLRVLDPSSIHLLYVDTGLMRNNETSEVTSTLASLGAKNVHIVHAESEFLGALASVGDPEEKRKIIGDLFVRIQDREIKRLGLADDYLLAQGTLYTDLIESGKGVGSKAALIKSHHNVRSPLIEALRNAGRIIEPFGTLYKDEVRSLGRKLGLADSIVDRHPFPGPGLGVRILGEVTLEKCDILRQADEIFISELKRRNLYREIWQAFCVLLPIRSVGVTGDARGYGYVLALRAITSVDGMTADVYPFDMKVLLEISNLITNKVKAIGRVSYDISSKPPATIEWE